VLFAFLAATAIGFSIAAERRRQEAERQKNVAELREQAARVLNLLPTSNVVSGMVLAIDTMARSRSAPAVEMAAQSSLLTAVQVSQETNRIAIHNGWYAVTSVAFSPDGKYIYQMSIAMGSSQLLVIR